MIDPIELSHIDQTGRAHMVDIGSKDETERTAVASGEIRMLSKTLALIQTGLVKKGDVLTVAQIAGIQAAKRTAELIPLCHQITLQHVDLRFEIDESVPGIRITCTVRTCGKTGAEMEALTAVSVSALTIYDMVKAAEKTCIIQNIRLVEKRGGKSGDVFIE